MLVIRILSICFDHDDARVAVSGGLVTVMYTRYGGRSVSNRAAS